MIENDLELHNKECIAGISRCVFRMGNTELGLEKVQELNDKNLIIKVASLSESFNCN